MPRQYLFPDGARFGSDNVVLHASARRHTVTDFAGPLSIKTVVHGAVPWIVGGRALVVDPGSFLVLGDGEKYSMDVDVPHAIETACAFFQRGLVERIAQDATDPVEASLDDPDRPATPLPSISRLHLDPDGAIVSRLQTLAKRCRAELQPSSSERGREFIHGHADGPLSLDAVAKAARLHHAGMRRRWLQQHDVVRQTVPGAIRDGSLENPGRREIARSEKRSYRRSRAAGDAGDLEGNEGAG